MNRQEHNHTDTHKTKNKNHYKKNTTTHTRHTQTHTHTTHTTQHRHHRHHRHHTHTTRTQYEHTTQHTQHAHNSLINTSDHLNYIPAFCQKLPARTGAQSPYWRATFAASWRAVGQATGLFQCLPITRKLVCDVGAGDRAVRTSALHRRATSSGMLVSDRSEGTNLYTLRFQRGDSAMLCGVVSQMDAVVHSTRYIAPRGGHLFYHKEQEDGARVHGYVSKFAAHMKPHEHHAGDMHTTTNTAHIPRYVTFCAHIGRFRVSERRLCANLFCVTQLC